MDVSSCVKTIKKESEKEFLDEKSKHKDLENSNSSFELDHGCSVLLDLFHSCSCRWQSIYFIKILLTHTDD